MLLKQQIRRIMPDAVLQGYRSYQDWRDLPPTARSQDRQDRDGALGEDPGSEAAIDACLAWLARAQDGSTTADGGVARHFSLIGGWSASYPETTGYIVPTLLREAAIRNDPDLRLRARRMLEWLVAIQLSGGGFQGGMITQKPVMPVTFNTGQILLGLAAGTKAFGDDRYREAMNRAASWLVETQDNDGCWRRHPTPFAEPGDKAYETHVAWGLFEAERVEPGQGYGEAGLKQVRWALTLQQENGWFDNCCLDDPKRPLTHTLGYVLRGILEAYRLSEDKALLHAAMKTADKLRDALGNDGFLPGRFDRRPPLAPHRPLVLPHRLGPARLLLVPTLHAHRRSPLSEGRSQSQRLRPSHHRHRRAPRSKRRHPRLLPHLRQLRPLPIPKLGRQIRHRLLPKWCDHLIDLWAFSMNAPLFRRVWGARLDHVTALGVRRSLPEVSPRLVELDLHPR